MAVHYSISKRKNPAKPDEAPKFYAQAQASGEADFKTLTRAAADRCTVTASDAKAVLDSLMTTMQDKLANGEIVRLQDLGSFRVVIGSKGVEAEDKFNSTMITKARIVFTPCPELKTLMKTLTFKKTGLAATKSTGGNEGGNEGGGGNQGGGGLDENPLG